MDSYARFQVHYDTQQKYDMPKVLPQQRIEIPSSWCGSRPGYGSYRSVKRTVTVIGTVETEHYGRQTAEYGKVAYNGHVVVVVQDGASWKAIDRKPVNGCIA